MNRSGMALVTGASSQLGVFLVPRLIKAGMDVLAVSREIPEGAVSDTEGVNWIAPGSESVQKANFLLSCGPLGLAANYVAKVEGLKKVIAFSTSSVYTKRESADESERLTINRIAEEEGKMRSICCDRNIPLVIIRPTLIYGCGMDSNISLLLKMGEKTGFIPLSRDAVGLRQPVHADDLAQLAVTALQADTGSFLEGEACGGSTLMFSEMAAKVAQCGSRKIRLLSLPSPILNAAVRVASFLAPGKGINPQMVHRQSEDMVFDSTVFNETLSWNPRPFEPGPEDFEIPLNLKKAAHL